MSTPAEDWQSSASLADGLRRLWHDDVATDVVFTFPQSGETVKAHRVVLMARSPVFFTMLSTPFYQAGEDIWIEDISSEVFRDLVRFKLFFFVRHRHFDFFDNFVVRRTHLSKGFVLKF